MRYGRCDLDRCIRLTVFNSPPAIRLDPVDRRRKRGEEGVRRQKNAKQGSIVVKL